MVNYTDLSIKGYIRMAISNIQVFGTGFIQSLIEADKNRRVEQARKAILDRQMAFDAEKLKSDRDFQLTLAQGRNPLQNTPDYVKLLEEYKKSQIKSQEALADERTARATKARSTQPTPSKGVQRKYDQEYINNVSKLKKNIFQEVDYNDPVNQTFLRQAKKSWETYNSLNPKKPLEYDPLFDKIQGATPQQETKTGTYAKKKR